MAWENVASQIISGEKSPNCIVDIEESLLSNDVDVVLSCLKAVEMLFCHFLKNKELSAEENTSNDNDSEKKYKNWLKSQYNDFKNHLIDYLHHDNEDVQNMTLKVLMSLIKSEVETPLKAVPEGAWSFPKELFTTVICQIIKSDDDTMINLLQEFLEFDDVKFYTLKALDEGLKIKEIAENDQYLRNVFLVLRKTQFPKSFYDPSSENLPVTFFETAGSKPFIVKETLFRNLFSTVWISFLKKKMSRELQKKVLLFLPKQVLPHLNKPLLLTDLLTDAYNIGGIISLLALNGIFFLIQNYNLEYPNFFKKLYTLLDVDVINSKYRARFFYLSDIFLSSILLPEYMVAAFLKKFSRLSLYSTPDLLLIILPFVRNLLIRHPSLKVLIHNNKVSNLLEDLYNFHEQDLEKSNALQSSLWEIKALQSHWHPEVASKANFINMDISLIETDLTSALDMDLDELLKKEKKSKFTDCPLSIEISSKHYHISWM